MPPPIANYYHILGVPRTCSKEQLKKAYYQLAKKFHPDAVSTNMSRQKQEEQFRLITTAYQTLSNPSERSMYDFRLSVSLDGDSVEFMGNNNNNNNNMNNSSSRLSKKSPFPPQSSHFQPDPNADPYAARREMYNYMFRQETPEEALRKRAHRIKMMRRGFAYMGGVALFLFVVKFYLVKKVYFDHIESLDKQAEHALQKTSEGTFYVSKKDFSGSYYSKVNNNNQSQNKQQDL